MVKFSKAVLRLGGILAALGAVLLVLGLLMGGRPQGIGFRWNNGRPTLDGSVAATQATGGAGRGDVTAAQSTNGGTVNLGPVPAAGETVSLDVNAAGAQVVLREGAYGISITDNYGTCTSTVENGVWRIEHEDLSLKNGNAPTITITLPADAGLKDVWLDIGAGTLTADGLQCESLTLNTGAGKAALNDLTCSGPCDLKVGIGSLTVTGALTRGATIDCGMGSVEMTLDAPESFGYDIDCGMGRVRVGDVSSSGIGQGQRAGSNSDVFFDVQCGMGNVDIVFRT